MVLGLECTIPDSIEPTKPVSRIRRDRAEKAHGFIVITKTRGVAKLCPE